MILKRSILYLLTVRWAISILLIKGSRGSNLAFSTA